MDRATFEPFENLAIPWKNQVRFEPRHLTETEQELYHHLLKSKLRLEQERIPHAFIVRAIQSEELI